VGVSSTIIMISRGFVMLPCLLLLAGSALRVFGEPDVQPGPDAALDDAGRGECLFPNRGMITQLLQECPRIIDDTTTFRTWAPWTHRPVCVVATSDGTTKYCVFTNANFGRYGVSLITTPEIAAGSVGVLEDSSENINITLQRGEGEGPPYEIRDIPGKGKGVVATRLIPKFKTFMFDHAALVAGTSFPESVKQVQGYSLLHRATEQLKDPDQVRALAKSSTTGADQIEDVLRTNSFQSDLQDLPHMALFPEISVRACRRCRMGPFCADLPN
jgi:hypothetical protein